MKKSVVLLFKIILSCILLFVLYVITCLAHGTYTDMKPEEIITLSHFGSSKENVINDSVLTFANWNVGYGGLGAESNFFYDSGGFLTSKGKMIRAPKNHVEKNIDGAVNFLNKHKADFYLFQEVDFGSKRSYFINQHELFTNSKKDYLSTFAVNYKSPRVPLPVLEFWQVMGKMNSGLGTYSRFVPQQSTRYQFPGNYGWPTRIFQLDRCFALHRINTINNKELILVNTHNSAYDDGTLKEKQMAYMKKILLEEYGKGNYVIVGGDWNQCPPGFKFDNFSTSEAGKGYSQLNVPDDYLPEGWQWVFDPSTPTNRKLTDIYKKGETFTTLIDFYLVSPNVDVLSVETIDQNFQFSDHQPVMMQVKLEGL